MREHIKFVLLTDEPLELQISVNIVIETLLKKKMKIKLIIKQNPHCAASSSAGENIQRGRIRARARGGQRVALATLRCTVASAFCTSKQSLGGCVMSITGVSLRMSYTQTEIADSDV